jgi:hypothetical protein
MSADQGASVLRCQGVGARRACKWPPAVPERVVAHRLFRIRTNHPKKGTDRSRGAHRFCLNADAWRDRDHADAAERIRAAW